MFRYFVCVLFHHLHTEFNPNLARMSLNFVSSESIKLALYDELHNLLSPVTEVRVGAEGRVKQLEITEGSKQPLQHYSFTMSSILYDF